MSGLRTVVCLFAISLVAPCLAQSLPGSPEAPYDVAAVHEADLTGKHVHGCATRLQTGLVLVVVMDGEVMAEEYEAAVSIPTPAPGLV